MQERHITCLSLKLFPHTENPNDNFISFSVYLYRSLSVPPKVSNHHYPFFLPTFYDKQKVMSGNKLIESRVSHFSAHIMLAIKGFLQTIVICCFLKQDEPRLIRALLYLTTTTTQLSDLVVSCCLIIGTPLRHVLRQKVGYIDSQRGNTEYKQINKVQTFKAHTGIQMDREIIWAEMYTYKQHSKSVREHTTDID